MNFKSQNNSGEKKNENRLILDFRVCLIHHMVLHTVSKFIEKLEDIEIGKYTKELLEDDDFYLAKALKAFTKRFFISQACVQQTEMTGNSIIQGLLRILTEYAFSEDEEYRNKIKGIIATSRLQETIHEVCCPEKSVLDVNNARIADFDIKELTEYHRLRLIVDFIASMTDKYSVELYQKLSGIRI